MAKTLLETIQQDLQAPDVQLPQRGQTEQIGGLLRAKLGKATEPGAAPRQSDIQEQQAIQQARLGAEQIGQRGQMLAAQQAEQQEDITQRAQQQQEQQAQQRQSLEQRYSLETDRLMDELLRSEKQLDNKSYLAKLEQTGANLRLQNRDYINKLKNEGQKLRLEDSLQFKNALAKDRFKNNQAILRDAALYDMLTTADDLEWQKNLADKDINFAIEQADEALRQEKTRQLVTGLGNLAGAGIQTVVAATTPKPKPKSETETETE